jgi:hypothetical protein
LPKSDNRKGDNMCQRIRLVALATCLASTVLPAANAAGRGSEGPRVLAQYVLLAYSAIEDRTVPLVRAVLAQPAASCPSVRTSAGDSLPMHRRQNPNPAAFGVVVCEAVVELATGVTAFLEGSKTALPMPSSGSAAADTVVVVGDSGCKAPKQDCATAWPFPAIAAAAALDAPDLVIHVGDYNYSGTPSKTGAGEWSYDGCVPADGSPLVTQSTYDTWATWNHDFFTPAAPLLAAAPWVVVRGNHELCSRAGQGWFFLLDPHSPLLDPYRSTPGCHAPTETTAPYPLTLGNLSLLVYDTANACGGEDPETAAGVAYEVQGYTRQLAQLGALLGVDPPATWLLGHRPIWSAEQFGSDAPSTENSTLQAAVAATPGGLPSAIAMLLSGHMHEFFTMAFPSAGRPPQLVIGNSGVAMESSTLPSPYALTVDGEAAEGLSINAQTKYGYLRATVKDGGHWQGEVLAFDAAGQAQTSVVARCALPLEQGRLCAR